KAFIPLNSGHGLKYPECPINEDGVPCCPNDSTLPMKPETSDSLLFVVIHFSMFTAAYASAVLL
ncbi:MAG: hypothetical protein ACOYIF_08670, partial [Acetivibrionales bacterium]